jgi:hypothetical protein
MIGLLLSMCRCNLKNDEIVKSCDDYNIISAECITRFYYDNDFKHLDTALIYLDDALINCKKFNKLFSLRKLSILSIKQEFSQAILFIDSFEKDFNGDLPYYKNLLKNRFIAMQAQHENKFEIRDSCLNIGINEIELFLSNKKTQLDSLLKQQEIDSILSNPISTAITQYYYYKSIVEGRDKITNEIFDKQIEISGNKDFFDYLKICLEEDFMNFIGI